MPGYVLSKCDVNAFIEQDSQSVFPLANRMSGLMEDVDHVFTFDRGEGSQEIFVDDPRSRKSKRFWTGTRVPEKQGTPPRISGST